MIRCRTCGKPLPSLCRRAYHPQCQPSRQDLSPAEIERRIKAARLAMQRERRIAA
jgi:hypothetical protein